MKLSTAIRLGAKLRPQCFDAFYQLVGNTIHSCVMGAAFEGAGFYNPVELKMPCHLEDKASLFDGIPEEWPAVMPKLDCPGECEQKYAVPALAAHLNDHHGWKRERIADFFEGIGY